MAELSPMMRQYFEIKSENEDVVKAFLDSSDTAELLSMKTFLPHIDGTDGFFTAVIRKKG